MYRYLVAVAALLMACGLVSGCSKTGVPMEGRPAAVVLTRAGAASTIVVVDLDRARVADRVRLRSACFSIDGDPSTRLVATSQSGVPHDRDKACGVYDVDAGGAVTYTDTQLWDPSDLAVVGTRAYIQHGLYADGHLFGSVIDLRYHSVVATVTLPDLSQRPERAAGRTLLPIAGAPPDPSGGTKAMHGRLAWFDEQGARSVLATLPLTSMTVLGSMGASTVAVVGRELETRKGSGAAWLCLLLDTRTGVVRRQVEVLGIERGIHNGCVVGGELALCDSDGTDPADPGRTVVMLDAETLRETRRIRVPGTPAAARAWQDSLVVFDPLERAVLVYREGEVRPSATVDMGGSQDVIGDLVVLP